VTETAPGIPGELPSSRQLLKSTAIAGCVAAVLLVTAVLPAEHGIDPTGIGQLLGLKRMGEIKERLTHEAEAAHAGHEHQRHPQPAPININVTRRPRRRRQRPRSRPRPRRRQRRRAT
jgi:hypothetical protein